MGRKGSTTSLPGEDGRRGEERGGWRQEMLEEGRGWRRLEEGKVWRREKAEKGSRRLEEAR